MILWEIVLCLGMVKDAEVEGAVREGMGARGGEKVEEKKPRSYHSTVMLSNMGHAVHQVTIR